MKPMKIVSLARDVKRPRQKNGLTPYLTTLLNCMGTVTTPMIKLL